MLMLFTFNIKWPQQGNMACFLLLICFWAGGSRVEVRLRKGSQTQSHSENEHQVENKYKAELSSAHRVFWRISEGTHPSPFVPAVGLHVPPRPLDSLAPESGAGEDLYLQDMSRRNSTQEAWYTHRQTYYILWTNRSTTPQQHKHPQDRNTLSFFLWIVGVFRALNLCYNAYLHKQCCYFVFEGASVSEFSFKPCIDLFDLMFIQ